MNEQRYILLCGSIRSKKFDEATIDRALVSLECCLQSKEGIEQLKSQPTAWTAFVFLVPSVLNTDLTKQAADVISRAVETMKEIKEVIAVSLVKDCKLITEGMVSMLKEIQADIATGKALLTMWSALVELLGKRVQELQVCNMLMSVAQTGFRHKCDDVRAMTFPLWALFIDACTTDYGDKEKDKRSSWLYRINELNQTLFLSNNTHSEASALAKAKAWWAWIVRFCDIGVIVNFETVVRSLLEFCIYGIIPRLSSLNKNNGYVSLPECPSTDSAYASVQAVGIEALLHCLHDGRHSENAESLRAPRTPILSSVQSLLANIRYLIDIVAGCLVNLGETLSESTVVDLWQPLVSNVKSFLEMAREQNTVTLREQCLDSIGHLLRALRKIVDCQRLTPARKLKLLSMTISGLPEKTLASSGHSFSVTTASKAIKSCPALALLEMCLSASTVPHSDDAVELFMEITNQLLSSGTVASCGMLDFSEQAVTLLAAAATSAASDVKALQCYIRVWINLVEKVLATVSETQDINQGQKLEEPNFSCAIQMLVFPMNAVFVHHKTIPTALIRSVQRLWKELYTKAASCAANVVLAEANALCDQLCSAILLAITTEMLKDVECVNMVLDCCETMVGQLDFSSREEPDYAYPLTPVKASGRKNRPLGRLHHPVQLLVKLAGCVGLAADSSMLDNIFNNGVPSSPAKATALTGLSGVIATVSRIITALVARTHVDVTLKRIACALGSTLNTLFGHIAGSGHSGSASRVTEVVTNAWSVLSSKLRTTLPMDMFDKDLLTSLTPLLITCLKSNDERVATETVAFMSMTFAHSSSTVDVPPNIKELLPANAGNVLHTPVKNSASIRYVDLLKSPEVMRSRSPVSKVGSLLNRGTSPELRNSPLKKIPTPKAASAGAKRKLSIGPLDTNNNGKDERFVVIPPPAQKGRRRLTEHQKEVARSKKIVDVTFYNDLDRSLDTQLHSQLTCDNTQLTCDSHTRDVMSSENSVQKTSVAVTPTFSKPTSRPFAMLSSESNKAIPSPAMTVATVATATVAASSQLTSSPLSQQQQASSQSLLRSTTSSESVVNGNSSPQVLTGSQGSTDGQQPQKRPRGRPRKSVPSDIQQQLLSPRQSPARNKSAVGSPANKMAASATLDSWLSSNASSATGSYREDTSLSASTQQSAISSLTQSESFVEDTLQFSPRRPNAAAVTTTDISPNSMDVVEIPETPPRCSQQSVLSDCSVVLERVDDNSMGGSEGCVKLSETAESSDKTNDNSGDKGTPGRRRKQSQPQARRKDSRELKREGRKALKSRENEDLGPRNGRQSQGQTKTKVTRARSSSASKCKLNENLSSQSQSLSDRETQEIVAGKSSANKKRTVKRLSPSPGSFDTQLQESNASQNLIGRKSRRSKTAQKEMTAMVCLNDIVDISEGSCSLPAVSAAAAAAEVDMVIDDRSIDDIVQQVDGPTSLTASQLCNDDVAEAVSAVRENSLKRRISSTNNADSNFAVVVDKCDNNTAASSEAVHGIYSCDTEPMHPPADLCQGLGDLIEDGIKPLNMMETEGFSDATNTVTASAAAATSATTAAAAASTTVPSSSIDCNVSSSAGSQRSTRRELLFNQTSSPAPTIAMVSPKSLQKLAEISLANSSGGRIEQQPETPERDANCSSPSVEKFAPPTIVSTPLSAPRNRGAAAFMSRGLYIMQAARKVTSGDAAPSASDSTVQLQSTDEQSTEVSQKDAKVDSPLVAEVNVNSVDGANIMSRGQYLVQASLKASSDKILESAASVTDNCIQQTKVSLAAAAVVTDTVNEPTSQLEACSTAEQQQQCNATVTTDVALITLPEPCSGFGSRENDSEEKENIEQELSTCSNALSMATVSGPKDVGIEFSSPEACVATTTSQSKSGLLPPLPDTPQSSMRYRLCMSRAYRMMQSARDNVASHWLANSNNGVMGTSCNTPQLSSAGGGGAQPTPIPPLKGILKSSPSPIAGRSPTSPHCLSPRLTSKRRASSVGLSSPDTPLKVKRVSFCLPTKQPTPAGAASALAFAFDNASDSTSAVSVTQNALLLADEGLAERTAAELVDSTRSSTNTSDEQSSASVSDNVGSIGQETVVASMDVDEATDNTTVQVDVQTEVQVGAKVQVQGQVPFSQQEDSDALCSEENPSGTIVDVESQLDCEKPVCPQLVNCDLAVETIATDLVSTTVWIPNIVRQLQGRGITTVGQLAALSEFDIHTLDFKPPKLDTVCNAFKGLLLRTPDMFHSVMDGNSSSDLQTTTTSDQVSTACTSACEPVIAVSDADAVSTSAPNDLPAVSAQALCEPLATDTSVISESAMGSTSTPALSDVDVASAAAPSGNSASCVHCGLPAVSAGAPDDPLTIGAAALGLMRKADWRRASSDDRWNLLRQIHEMLFG